MKLMATKNLLVHTDDVEFNFGSFSLNPARRELREDGQVVRLGSRALDILTVLVSRSGEVISKESLLISVWPGGVVDDGALRVHIAALRKTLRDGIDGRRFISNAPLRGYCFVTPVSRQSKNGGATASAQQIRSPSSLPAPLNRLIGREEAMDAASSLLRERRLVTLVGPGGIGKTSLALSIAHRLEVDYLHGVFLIDLDTLVSASLVPIALVTALGLQILSSDPLSQVAAYLKDRRVVLVFDNCEHVIEAVTQVVENLLRHAPHVCVLATSREPLLAQGEWIYRLGPLELPMDDCPSSLHEALNFSAIDLFIERMSASADKFELGDKDVSNMVRICKRVDGIPLAIELVARRVRLFGLEGLVTMLEDRLSVVTQGHRTALPRHKTLHATLDWSFELLSENEKYLLCCLAVFKEGFSLEHAVTIAQTISLSAAVTTELVANLIDKSLISLYPNDWNLPYHLLNTTRTYATEKMKSYGLHAATQVSHATLFCELVKHAEQDLAAMDPNEWCRRNGRKIDDVRAALEWAFSSDGDVVLGVELVAASASLWFHLWLLNEYLGWLNKALMVMPSANRDGRDHMRMTLALGQAQLCTSGPTHDTAKNLQNALIGAERLGDVSHQLKALWGLYSCHNILGDYHASLSHAERFGELAVQMTGQAEKLTHYRMAALSHHLVGNQRLAREYVEQALIPLPVTNFLLHGNPYQIDHWAASLTQQARILWMQGYPAKAMRAAQEAVERAESINHALSLTYVLAFGACPVALWAGDIELSTRYQRKLLVCTVEHSLLVWQGWAKIYEQALKAVANGLSGQGQLGVSTFSDVSLGPAQVDMMATMGAQFIGDKAISRVKSELNGWCAAEIYRAIGERFFLQGVSGHSQAEHYFLLSLDIAKKQDAHIWELKTASSLASLRLVQGCPRSAIDDLDAAHAWFVEDYMIQDLKEAKRLQVALRIVRDRQIDG